MTRPESLMKRVAVAVALVLVASLHAQSSATGRGAAGAFVALRNARVRAYRTTAGALAGVAHAPGVIVWLENGSAGKAGRAMWLDDAAVPPPGGAGSGSIVIVEPVEHAASGTAAPPSGSKPGDAPFTGMSFVPLFENARVSVLRARMEVDAHEGFHTHASDTVVVHLSGGEIEDTADSKTVVNRWKPGDVEFEARGSSHSARNIGHAIDVVLVALKP
jgi:quercetin dioxygenase-like cupin family protein